MGIPGHSCHESRCESRLWVGRRNISSALKYAQLLSYHRMMPTSRGYIFIMIKLKLDLTLLLYCVMYKNAAF